jgi:hypothetical protein
LEEIDLIFAKGYLEKISYVKASHEMPYLSDREVEAMARQYGFADSDEEEKIGEKAVEGDSSNASEEKQSRNDSEHTLQMRDEQEGGFRND